MATRYRPRWYSYSSFSRKKLTSEKIDKSVIGREKFIEKVWEWKEQYGDIIINQLKNLVALVIGQEMPSLWMRIYPNQ